jgi:hypothetical protein
MTEEGRAPECAEGRPHLALLLSQFFAHAPLWFACLLEDLLLERERHLARLRALLCEHLVHNLGGFPFRVLHMLRDPSGYVCDRRDEIPEDHYRRVGVRWLYVVTRMCRGRHRKVPRA